MGNALFWFAAITVAAILLIGSLTWAAENWKRVLGWAWAALVTVGVVVGYVWLSYHSA